MIEWKETNALSVHHRQMLAYSGSRMIGSIYNVGTENWYWSMEPAYVPTQINADEIPKWSYDLVVAKNIFQRLFILWSSEHNLTWKDDP